MSSHTIVGYAFVFLTCSSVLSSVDSKAIQKSNFPEISREKMEEFFVAVESHTCSAEHSDVIYGISFKIVFGGAEPSTSYKKTTRTTYAFIKDLTDFIMNYNDLNDGLQIFFHKKLFDNYLRVSCMIVDGIVDEEAWADLEKYANSSNEKKRVIFSSLSNAD